MSTIDELSDAFKKRDAIEQALLPYFSAFAVASERSNNSLAISSSSPTKAEPVDAPLHSRNKSADLTENDSELIERLKESRRSLEKQLRTLQTQLERSQERARAVSEEHYLKTSAVQGLHDEILALTVQLNLSEERRKKLQDELGR